MIFLDSLGNLNIDEEIGDRKTLSVLLGMINGIVAMKENILFKMHAEAFGNKLT